MRRDLLVILIAGVCSMGILISSTAAQEDDNDDVSASQENIGNNVMPLLNTVETAEITTLATPTLESAEQTNIATESNPNDAARFILSKMPGTNSTHSNDDTTGEYEDVITLTSVVTSRSILIHEKAEADTGNKPVLEHGKILVQKATSIDKKVPSLSEDYMKEIDKIEDMSVILGEDGATTFPHEHVTATMEDIFNGNDNQQLPTNGDKTEMGILEEWMKQAEENKKSSEGTTFDTTATTPKLILPEVPSIGVIMTDVDDIKVVPLPSAEVVTSVSSTEASSTTKSTKVVTEAVVTEVILPTTENKKTSTASVENVTTTSAATPIINIPSKNELEVITELPNIVPLTDTVPEVTEEPNIIIVTSTEGPFTSKPTLNNIPEVFTNFKMVPITEIEVTSTEAPKVSTDTLSTNVEDSFTSGTLKTSLEVKPDVTTAGSIGEKINVEDSIDTTVVLMPSSATATETVTIEDEKKIQEFMESLREDIKQEKEEIEYFEGLLKMVTTFKPELFTSRDVGQTQTRGEEQIVTEVNVGTTILTNKIDNDLKSIDEDQTFFEIFTTAQVPDIDIRNLQNSTEKNINEIASTVIAQHPFKIVPLDDMVQIVTPSNMNIDVVINNNNKEAIPSSSTEINEDSGEHEESVTNIPKEGWAETDSHGLFERNDTVSKSNISTNFVEINKDSVIYQESFTIFPQEGFTIAETSGLFEGIDTVTKSNITPDFVDEVPMDNSEDKDLIPTSTTTTTITTISTTSTTTEEPATMAAEKPLSIADIVKKLLAQSNTKSGRKIDLPEEPVTTPKVVHTTAELEGEVITENLQDFIESIADIEYDYNSNEKTFFGENIFEKKNSKTDKSDYRPIVLTVPVSNKDESKETDEEENSDEDFPIEDIKITKDFPKIFTDGFKDQSVEESVNIPQVVEVPQEVVEVLIETETPKKDKPNDSLQDLLATAVINGINRGINVVKNKVEQVHQGFIKRLPLAEEDDGEDTTKEIFEEVLIKEEIVPLTDKQDVIVDDPIKDLAYDSSETDEEVKEMEEEARKSMILIRRVLFFNNDINSYLSINFSMKITVNNLDFAIPEDVLIEANKTESAVFLDMSWRANNTSKNSLIFKLEKGDETLKITGVVLDLHLTTIDGTVERFQFERNWMNIVEWTRGEFEIKLGNENVLHIAHLDLVLNEQNTNEIGSTSFQQRMTNGTALLIVAVTFGSSATAFALGYLIYLKFRSKANVFKVGLP